METNRPKPPRPVLSIITHNLPKSPELEVNILNLPLELQICILSELPIAGQLFASMVCTTWEDIILNSRSFQKSRYHKSNEKGYEDRHRLLTHPGGLLCHIQRGIVQTFQFPPGEDNDFPLDYHDYNSKILTVNRLDITNCKILDEPIFSPFSGGGQTIFDDSMIMVGPCTCKRETFSCSSGFPASVPRDTTIREFITAIAAIDGRGCKLNIDVDECLMYIDEGYGTAAAYDNDLTHRLILRTIGIEGRGEGQQAGRRVWNEAILFLHLGSEPLNCKSYFEQ
ncbi:hypothetical protein TWF281_004858 [Arthrobotrys megalospora]